MTAGEDRRTIGEVHLHQTGDDGDEHQQRREAHEIANGIDEIAVTWPGEGCPCQQHERTEPQRHAPSVEDADDVREDGQVLAHTSQPVGCRQREQIQNRRHLSLWLQHPSRGKGDRGRAGDEHEP